MKQSSSFEPSPRLLLWSSSEFQTSCSYATSFSASNWLLVLLRAPHDQAKIIQLIIETKTSMYFTNIFSAGEQVLVQDRALTQHRPAQFQRNVFLSNTDPIKRACVDRQTRPQTHTHTYTHTHTHDDILILYIRNTRMSLACRKIYALWTVCYKRYQMQNGVMREVFSSAYTYC